MTALVEHDIEQGAGRLHAGLTDPGLASTVAAGLLAYVSGNRFAISRTCA